MHAIQASSAHASVPELVIPPVRSANHNNFRGLTWQAAAGQHQVSAPLSRLPAGVAFPEDFPEPVRYDAARKVIEYRGFMPHPSFVELQKMSNDYDYLRALESIFADSAQETTPSSGFKLAYILAPAGILVAGVVGWMLWG